MSGGATVREHTQARKTQTDQDARRPLHRLVKQCDHNLMGKSIVELLRDGEAICDTIKDLDSPTHICGNPALGSRYARHARNPVGK